MILREEPVGLERHVRSGTTEAKAETEGVVDGLQEVARLVVMGGWK